LEELSKLIKKSWKCTCSNEGIGRIN
jgi:hypothetical protein